MAIVLREKDAGTFEEVTDLKALTHEDGVPRDFDYADQFSLCLQLVMDGSSWEQVKDLIWRTGLTHDDVPLMNQHAFDQYRGYVQETADLATRIEDGEVILPGHLREFWEERIP